MVMFRAELGIELTQYVESLIDNKVILNRTDAIRQIINEHKNIKEKDGWIE